MPEIDEKPEDEQQSVVEAVEYDLEIEDRKWLRAFMPILTMQADGTEHEYDGRVQLDWFEMKIAVFKRVKRIAENDLAEEDRT